MYRSQRRHAQSELAVEIFPASLRKPKEHIELVTFEFIVFGDSDRLDLDIQRSGFAAACQSGILLAWAGDYGVRASEKVAGSSIKLWVVACCVVRVISVRNSQNV